MLYFVIYLLIVNYSECMCVYLYYFAFAGHWFCYKNWQLYFLLQHFKRALQIVVKSCIPVPVFVTQSIDHPTPGSVSAATKSDLLRIFFDFFWIFFEKNLLMPCLLLYRVCNTVLFPIILPCKRFSSIWRSFYHWTNFSVLNEIFWDILLCSFFDIFHRPCRENKWIKIGLVRLSWDSRAMEKDIKPLSLILNKRESGVRFALFFFMLLSFC